MSDRARRFLTDWTARHIQPIPYFEHEGQGRRLAAFCLNDAARVGISHEELAEEARHGLVNHLIDALEDRADREIFKIPA